MTQNQAPSLQQLQDSVYMLAGAAGIAYAARASGLYCSHDGGVTWQNTFRTPDLKSLASVAVAVHDQTVFAGVKGAVLRSDDAGETWQIGVLGSPPPLVTSLALSPTFAEDGVVFAGTAEDGVFVSTDRGDSWVAWNFGLIDLNAYALAISPAFNHDRTIFVGTESGVFLSRNGGRGWRETTFPMDAAPVLSLTLTPQGLLFAGTESCGLYLSDDFGSTWQKQKADLPTGAVNAVYQVPQSIASVVLLIENRLARSDDGGQSWAVSAPFRPDQTAMSLLQMPDQPRSFLVGFDDGAIITVTT